MPGTNKFVPAARLICDGCGKERRDVKSCGLDSNGDPDAPDLCFLCRVEWAKNRKVYDIKLKRYVHVEEYIP